MSSSGWREPLLAVAGVIVSVAAAAVGVAIYFQLNGDNDTPASDLPARITVVIATQPGNLATATKAPPNTPTSAPAPPSATRAASSTATPSQAATPTATATSTPTAAPTPTVTPTPTIAGLALERTTFALPADATANGGRTIGPFCCRGRTVTLRTAAGEIVGYAYWFQWQGQAYDAPRGAGFDGIYPDIRVLVNDAASGTATIALAASEMSPGVSRTITTERLRFTVTFTGAEQTNFQGATYVWESSLAATLTVEPR